MPKAGEAPTAGPRWRSDLKDLIGWVDPSSADFLADGKAQDQAGLFAKRSVSQWLGDNTNKRACALCLGGRSVFGSLLEGY